MPALRGAPTGPRSRAGGLHACAGLHGLPDFAAGARAGIAAAYASHAGRRRTDAVAAGRISGARAEVAPMDMGTDFRFGGNRRLRSLYLYRRALAGTVGGCGIRRHKSSEFIGFSRRLLERMAICDHTSRGAGDADRGGIRFGDIPQTLAARVGIGIGAGGNVRGAPFASAGGRNGVSQSADRRSEAGGNHQGRHLPFR